MAINLNGTGSISGLSSISAPAISGVPTGSASAPAFSFTGDSNTGVYSPGADQVAISTNGTGRLFVDSSGNVGLGTATPASNSITVSRSSGYVECRVNSGSNTNAIAVDGTTSYIGNYSNIPLSFTTNSLERLRITAAGLVGIGTSAPSSKLYVSETSTTAPSLTYGATAAFTMLGGNVELAGGLSGTTPFPYWLQTRDSTNAARALVINPLGGNVGIGTTSAQQLLHVNSSAASGGQIQVTNASTGAASTDGVLIGYDGSNDVIINNQEATALKLSTSGTERCRLDSSGRLLVGTSSAVAAGAKLQTVDGITFPAAQVSSSDPNTLDDYEEGTWTPTVGGTATYTKNTGNYTKLGRLVNVSFELYINTIGTGSQWQIFGLPFTATSTGSQSQGGSVGYINSLATNIVSTFLRADAGDTYLVLASLTAAGTFSANNNILGNGSRIYASITYMAS